MTDSEEILGAPYSRLFSYFVAEFMLRVALPVAAVFENDYEQAVIYLAISIQNSQNLMHNQATRKEYSSLANPVPDQLMRPISRLALARSTNLPRETVRRKVAKLLARGSIVETPTGLIIAPTFRENPDYLRTVSVQESNLRRLLAMVAEALASDPGFGAALVAGFSAAR